MIWQKLKKTNHSEPRYNYTTCFGPGRYPHPILASEDNRIDSRYHSWVKIVLGKCIVTNTWGRSTTSAIFRSAAKEQSI